LNALLKKALPYLLIGILFFSIITEVVAQSQPDVRINTISTIELPDSVNLKVYFNLFDKSSGQAITDISPESAQITLLNTGLTTGGVIRQPDIPIYITMVLDASGSMSGAQAQLKDAAKLALTNVPNDAFFSVVQFDEEIVLLQDFTENQSAISFAIDQMKVTGRGTCLYDAAYTAVEAMEKAPVGRRAVILFTDGKDETREGKVCSQHTYRELVDKAMKAQVPIHTIGLSVSAGNINAVELENMAASTGGFSAIGNESQLKNSFEQIMLGLKAQWMVESSVYPRQGDNNAVLTMNLKDVGETSTAFIVTSSKEYPGPPSPVSAKLDGFVLRPETMTYDVQISLTSPEMVNYLRVAIWEKEGGSKITEFVFENLASFNSLNIPTNALTAGRDYEMRVVATDKENNFPFAIVKDDQGKALTELIHEFKFDPSGVLPKLSIQSVIQDNNDLVIQIATTNPLLVKGYDGWLIDEETNTVVPNSTFSSDLLPNGSGSITIPMVEAKVPSGKYTILVRALGEETSVFATQQYNGVVYQAKKISIFERVFTALKASPIFFYIILGIILVVIAFLMIYNWREKSLSGTPVMQGRLGGQMKTKRGKKEPSPFADHEPIPGASVARPVQPPPAQRSAPQAYDLPVMPTPVAKPTPASIPPDQLDRTIVGAPPLGDATMVSPAIKLPSLSVVNAPPGVLSPGQKISVQQLPFTIGRVGAMLTVSDASVSRLHAQITMDSQSRRYQITDMNSSNGTRVNGTPITSGQPTFLNHGSRIQIGPNVEIVFET
jgi:VWFA-related protein